MILIGVLVFVSAYFGPRYQPAVVAIVTLAVSLYGCKLIYHFYKQSKFYLAGILSILYSLGAFVWGIRAVMVLFFGIGFAFEGGPFNAISFSSLLILGVLRFMVFAGLVMAIAENEREQLTIQFHQQKVEFMQIIFQRLKHIYFNLCSNFFNAGGFIPRNLIPDF